MRGIFVHNAKQHWTKIENIFIWALVFMVCLTSVFAFPNPDISLEPTELYETNNALFNLTVDNLFKNEVVSEISLTFSLLNVTSVVEFFGWDYNNSFSSLRWYNGDIETNSISLFQFYAQAGLVNANLTENITIITKNESGSGTTIIVPIIIIDDVTPPSVLRTIPVDGGLLREGIIDQLVLIEAEDNETGLKEATFSYWNCTGNVTKNETSINLPCVNNTCQSNVDLSAFEEGEDMCFQFIVYNNALENSTENGTVSFDGTAPVVTLIAPAHNGYGNNATIFRFNASDNLAPTLSCELIFDNSVVDITTVNNNVISNVAYNLSGVFEGSYVWKINCTDTVGWSGMSGARTIIIDTTAPVITLNSPANGSSLGDGIIIDINVTDNYEVANVTYSQSLNTSNLPEGVNIITVNATDGAGNTATKSFTFIIDRTAPTINIISPADNATVDVHINFTFIPNDNLDNALNCSLYINNVLNYTAEYPVGSIVNMSRLLPMNLYTWFLSCEDDAGNEFSTIIRNLNVTDVTGPDIVSDIIYVARGEPYYFGINITDISGVANVTMIFNNTELALVQLGTIYSGDITTDISYPLGNYTLNITAYDNLSNLGNLLDEFELIQGYVINLTLNPSSVKTGKDVVASGTVELDNGSEVPEDNLTLNLPNTSVIVNITNKTFTYTFAAPGIAGTYDVDAIVTSVEGFNHEVTEELNVTAVGIASSSSSSSSSNKGNGGSGNGDGDLIGYCGDGRCNKFEDCNDCSEDCGICPELEIIQEEVKDNKGSANLTEREEEASRNPLGIGAATGLFRTLVFNPFSIILFLILITVLLLLFTYKRKRTIYIK